LVLLYAFHAAAYNRYRHVWLYWQRSLSDRTETALLEITKHWSRGNTAINKFQVWFAQSEAEPFTKHPSYFVFGFKFCSSRADSRLANDLR
jgi:hypothetical protein